MMKFNSFISFVIHNLSTVIHYLKVGLELVEKWQDDNELEKEEQKNIQNDKLKQNIDSKNYNTEFTLNTNMESKKHYSRGGMSITGFIISLLAFMVCWIPLINLVFWLPGLVFSIVGLPRRRRGLAVAGVFISIFTLLFIIIFMSVYSVAFIYREFFHTIN